MTEKTVTGPVPYVWVEVHEIMLHEETTVPEKGIGTSHWPATHELESEIAAARATHGRVSSILQRKDAWEARLRV